MSTIRKRLHVSGLTPSITANDLNMRFKSFGKVVALDGFGTLNGIEQPRKFAYITLETTEANLTRCFNLLSGSTWKGTKLRIGEAKPDFRQRLEQERKQALEQAAEPPTKRRRLAKGVRGVHSNDMTLVTSENVQNRPGWQVTALAHLVRPMKMRPSHPLKAPSIQGDNNPRKKQTKRNKVFVPSRARITAIDPRMYGSTHLRGNMLESIIVDPQLSRTQEVGPNIPMRSSTVITPPSWQPRHQEREASPLEVVPSPDEMDIQKIDLAAETSRNLEYLREMFGDEDENWGGKESVDDEDQAGHDTVSTEENHVDQTIVVDKEERVRESSSFSTAPVVAKKTEQASLKELFKSQENEFSLKDTFGDLDLDPAFSFGEPQRQPTTQVVRPVSSLKSTLPSGDFTLDTSLPLFFPQSDNPRANDIFAVAKMEGWQFGRSGDSESIRKRWEEKKGALTKEWKKRAREAQKARRRHYGTAEGEDAQ